MKTIVKFEICCNNSEATTHAFVVCMNTILEKKLRIDDWKLYVEPSEEK